MAGKKASGSAVVRHELKENLQAGDTILEMKNIVKKFDGVTAVDGVSFSMKKGEIVAIIGPSGSGKSTLLRSINGLENITDGEIDLYGTTGMVFQHFNLFPNMTIRKNITLAPVRTKLLTQAEADDTATTLLRRVGLEDKADSYPAQLSGGQKQRIAIARVFLKNPPILILDEATSALDNESEILVGQSLEKLAHGRTTLTIAHRLTTIKDYDRILVLGEEGIVESGTHDQLLAKQGVYYRLWNQLPGEDTL